MSEIQKKEVNESMVISIMILHGDYMSQVLNIMYIFMHLCDKWQYMLSATYIMTCTGFVFRVGDYPLSSW